VICPISAGGLNREMARPLKRTERGLERELQGAGEGENMFSDRAEPYRL